MNCQEAVLSLGAYVLGALDPAERAQVEDHLRVCPGCRQELADLDRLPTLLARVPIAEAEAGLPQLPSDSYLRLAARAQDLPRRSARLRWPAGRRTRWLVAAVAAVVLAITGVAVSLSRTGTPQPASYTATSGTTRLAVEVSEQSGHSVLDVTVTGLAPEQRCELVAVADNGKTDPVGWWQATPSGGAWFKGSTDIPAKHLMRLILLDPTGHQLIAVDT